METQQVANNGFLQRPDKNVIQALFNLKDNKDFKVIREWMLSSSCDVDNILRTVDAEFTLHRAQGASSVLLAFVSHAGNTNEVLAKIKRQEAGIVFPGEQPMENLNPLNV